MKNDHDRQNKYLDESYNRQMKEMIETHNKQMNEVNNKIDNINNKKWW